MKTKLLFKGAIAAAFLIFNQVDAQEYQPITIQSGFNADVIANGVGASATSTNNDVDGVSYAFISTDFKLTAAAPGLSYGLPANGIINSAVGSTIGLNYVMAPYSSNNSLRLQNTNDSGTLTFTNPTPALSLYMLATGGSGDTAVDAVVNFSDGTNQTFTSLAISDWYYGSNYAIKGIGRVNITNDNLEDGYGDDPRLYQIPLSIDAVNQSKNIVSVTITKTGTGGIPNIFAFSADVYNSCAAPTNLTYTSAMQGATINWTAPAMAPSSGYDYYYSTTSTPPTATTAPLGSVAAGTTSVTLSGLPTGQSYYFWVRSNCGSVKGFWKMIEIATGQVSTTYTSADINTTYSDYPGPDNSSTSSCPATLTINIPTGYKIASTKVSYDMTAQANAYMSEQRSLLVCTTNNTAETNVSSGVGGDEGVYSYERSGLSIANDLTGSVSFQMHAWRMWGDQSLGCDASFNRVDNNTWKVTVTLQPIALATNETAPKAKERLAYPNPFQDVLNIEKSENIKRLTVTDLSGITVKTVENPTSTLRLEGVKSGVYILSYNMKDGSLKSTKIIKK
ncbi:T9SS type A sorting domain-containing protein [Chryseobacterium sp. 3008163]|uniref:T9SS type A sorting domain-containing protein n=1 Tax=Chryseobacterium sp. 3008163 TaxID=2478663 RepID=UPI000F0C8B89|nr:T9SS type A sorting domain-containing protein [Chryseobacterium sp. 3008163]AYN00364.1 T9SS C-terminal target domain-containing protein [Chryseobacterium sp. 3008163]